MCTCRFEQLALEYDSDELGDLDELEGGGDEPADVAGAKPNLGPLALKTL